MRSPVIWRLRYRSLMVTTSCPAQLKPRALVRLNGRAEAGPLHETVWDLGSETLLASGGPVSLACSHRVSEGSSSCHRGD